MKEQQFRPAPPGGCEEALSNAELTAELLRSYQRILDVVDDLPGIVWMAQTEALPRLRIPRSRWLVRTFVVQHVLRSLGSLKRRYYARSALGLEEENAPAFRAIDSFENSLPPLPSRLAVSVFLLGVFLIALALGSLVATTRDQAKPLGETTKAILSFDPSNVANSLSQFDSVESVLVAALALSMSLYLVVLIPMSSFLLKRALFNLHPYGDAGSVGKEYAADHRFGAAGIYAIEARLCETIGTKPVRELRLDLLVDALVMVLSLLLGVTFIGALLRDAAGAEGSRTEAIREFLFGQLTLSLLAVVLVSISSVRLLKLGSVWRNKVPSQAREDEERRVRVRAETIASLTKAGWNRRAAASLVDGLFLLVDGLFLLIGWFGLWTIWIIALGNMESEEASRLELVGLLLVCPVLAFFPNALLLSRRGQRNGQTIGKQLFGVRVVPLNGKPVSLSLATRREVFAKGLLFGVPSLILLGVPAMVNYYWPLQDDDGRALHDHLARTAVARARPI